MSARPVYALLQNERKLTLPSGPIELVEWKEGKEIHDSFQASINGQSQDIKIEPDAFFSLRETLSPIGERKTRHFLLEADRSSMPKKERSGSRRFNDKICKYECYIREGRPSKALQVPQASILAVTLTKLRRDSLASSAAEILPEGFRKYFLFGSLQDLPFENPAAIFHPVFLKPGQAEASRPLMP